MKLKLIIAVAAIAATGCSMAPHKQIEGLQDLHTTHKVVEPGEIWRECQDSINVNLLAWPLACAKIRFAEHTCVTVTATNSTPDTVEHENLHCQGFDHGAGIQEAYDAWKAAGGKRIDN